MGNELFEGNVVFYKEFNELAFNGAPYILGDKSAISILARATDEIKNSSKEYLRSKVDGTGRRILEIMADKLDKLGYRLIPPNDMNTNIVWDYCPEDGFVKIIVELPKNNASLEKLELHLDKIFSEAKEEWKEEARARKQQRTETIEDVLVEHNVSPKDAKVWAVEILQALKENKKGDTNGFQ